MKLSENGSVEIGLGAVIALCGLSPFLFPRSEIVADIGKFGCGMMFMAGIVLALYGLRLRKGRSRRRAL